MALYLREYVCCVGCNEVHRYMSVWVVEEVHEYNVNKFVRIGVHKCVRLISVPKRANEYVYQGVNEYVYQGVLTSMCFRVC